MTDTMDRQEVALTDIPLGRDLVPQDRRLLPAPLEQLVEVANLLATGGVLVPKAFRGQQELCLGVAYQAALWGTDPVATINKAYVVNDRIAYEAQLINAIVLGHLERRPDYAYEGAGTTRQCRVTATPKGDAPKPYTTPQLGQIKVKNSPLWITDPDQQLSYMAIRAWARRHMPDVLLGIYAVEELQSIQIRDVTPAGPDPFAEDADLDHLPEVEAEDADAGQPFEPSGGFSTDAPTQACSAKQQPVQDDPLEWAEEAKEIVDSCEHEAALIEYFTGTEANRKALFAADKAASRDLDDRFTQRQRELRAAATAD